MNIYAGRRFGWDWQDHIDNGKLGGDDMVAPPGELILAPVAGTVSRTTHSFTITEPDGWRTVCLELERTKARTSVSVGDVIGESSSKWPHWHSLNPDGVRVPARFLHTSDLPAPTPTPTPDIEEDTMPDIRYLHKKADDVSAAEYGIFGRELPGGFNVSADVRDGEAWGRVYGKADGSPWIANLTRDQWINTQRAFTILHNEWVAQNGPTVTADGITRADLNTASANIIAAIPTATDNAIAVDTLSKQAGH